MYLPAHFAETRAEVLHAFVRDEPLGLLVTQDTDCRVSADGVPFLLDADPDGGPGILRAHVARANPLWHRARTDSDSLIVFQGPHAYVSPSFYPGKATHGKVVPTWNYLMVQARGRLRPIEDAAWLHALVGRLTDRHEAHRTAPWSVTDAPDDYVATMLSAIVGIEIVTTELLGKWKASQNRSATDRAGIASGLQADGVAQARRLSGISTNE